MLAIFIKAEYFRFSKPPHIPFECFTVLHVILYCKTYQLILTTPGGITLFFLIIYCQRFWRTTLIRKAVGKNQDKTVLGNWRPISRLNTDYKIATRAILPSIIHNNQAGYVKSVLLRRTFLWFRILLNVVNTRRFLASRYFGILRKVLTASNGLFYSRLWNVWVWTYFSKMDQNVFTQIHKVVLLTMVSPLLFFL